MHKLLALCMAVGLYGQPAASELARWQQQAQAITIVRDDWGIAHVTGRTDADAVFGAMYAQAEDDFPRIETNYLTALGRMAEAEGEARLWQDLRMRLFIDPAELRAQYAASPAWLKKLMDAFADGLNYYLAKHPEVKPRVIRRFEPWMALSFTEGSIGGDIESINLTQLAAFYGQKVVAADRRDEEPRGSNGIAIAPANTANRRALLLINPHTTFFFRSELQMTSGEGLNAYGASTWGQFFIYQGFNDRAGWMHTTSNIDRIDEYRETVEPRGTGHVYRHGNGTRNVEARRIAIAYRTPQGLAERVFTVYRTHHGPVVRAENGQWITVRLMHEPVKALSQSYLRTKARNYAAFVETMELKTNSSNNTLYADADGTIAYFHGNFLPRRDRRFDWTKPVDGSLPAADWGPLHALSELPSLRNPPVGWVYNTNNWPWSAAGPDSRKQADYPAYVDNGTENARGLHALRVLTGVKNWTVDSLVTAAYDSYLPWFEKPVPALVRAWESLPSGDPRRAKLAEPVALLRAWDLRWGVQSVPTALAIFWAEELRRRQKASLSLVFAEETTRLPADALVGALQAAVDQLAADFGRWQTPWGEINRFQRLTGAIEQPFNDQRPSLPVGFPSGNWGSLASFGARTYPGTKRWYGTSGNSFVAVVEFGERVRARAISAGGASGSPASLHFNDQAGRYAAGELRDVYFYPEQLNGHTQRKYVPGQ